MRRPVVAIAALALAVFGACGRSAQDRPTVRVTLTQGAAAIEIRAEVAATPEERARGLMGRRSLPDHAGMLFLFPGPGRVSFFMKDTLIPLDIAFIRAGVVREVRSMTPCRAEPCPLTTPDEAFDSALEVNAGVFGRAGIGPGALMVVSGRLPPAR